MTALNERPIVFPLSNPVALSECEFADAVAWSGGRVIFASGSPFAPVTFGGHEHVAGQGNNMVLHSPLPISPLADARAQYVFPGLGLGAILARATSVTDSMVEAASLALANSLTTDERAAGLIYPRLERIREISVVIAAGVVREAQKRGVDAHKALRAMGDAELHAWVRARMWQPMA